MRPMAPRPAQRRTGLPSLGRTGGRLLRPAQGPASPLIRQIVSEGLHHIPLVGQALEVASLPSAIANLFGDVHAPDMATGAANALVGGGEALFHAPGDFFTGGIDPFFDATTPAAQARARAEGTLIRQNLRTTGRKFVGEGV